MLQVNKNTEVAMSSNYNLQSGNVLIALGGKYTLEDGAVLKVGVCACTCACMSCGSQCYFHRLKSTIMDRSV